MATIKSKYKKVIPISILNSNIDLYHYKNLKLNLVILKIEGMHTDTI